jgi:hypothetical protein
MSGYTGTQFETLYANYGAATTTSPSASAVSLIVGMPEIVIPSNFMKVVGSQSSSIHVKAGGIMTCTATIPTFTIGLATTSVTPAAFATTNNLGSTAALAPAGTTASTPWFLDVEIGLRTLAQGAASTVVTFGEFRSEVYTAAPIGMTPIPAVAGAVTMTTWEVGLQYFLWPYLILSAATAGNTMTTEYVKVYGEN